MPSNSIVDRDYAVYLNPEELPRKWYNMVLDLPEKLAPMLSPHNTREPLAGKDCEWLFPKDLIYYQEFSQERWFDIPEAVWDAYRRLPQPSLLVRAKRRLEDYLRTCSQNVLQGGAVHTRR